MVGRFIGRRAPMSFDVADAQRMEAGRQARIRERAARATPQPEAPQVQREVRQAAPPLQLAPQSRFVDPSEIATAITGRGPQGLNTDYKVNLIQPSRMIEQDGRMIVAGNSRPAYEGSFGQIGLGNLVAQSRIPDRAKYIAELANAKKASMYGGMGNFEPQAARPQQSESSPYYEGKYVRSNNRNALEATKTQYNDLLADGAIAPFSPVGQTNEDNYLKSVALNTAQQMTPYNRPPSLPRGATGELKGIPAVDMEYGRIEALPNGMKQQGSFYTPVQLGTGTTELYGVDDMLKFNEEAIDSFGGGSNSRFMRGNDYNGYEVVDPADKKGWGESIPFDKSDTWVNSGAYAPARFTKSEREYTPLMSINSQGKPAAVPQSDELSSSVVPAWQNGNVSPEYSSVIPQRLVDSIDKNVMATRPSRDVTEQMLAEGVPLVPVQNIPESTPLRGSPSTLREQFSLGASPLGRRELVTGTVPSAFQNQDGMNEAIEAAMTQQQRKGSYSMQTFEDPAVFAAYETNFAQAGKELMLPSTAIRDRTVTGTRRQGPGGILAPIQSEPVLSPYPLSLDSSYGKSDLTAKSTMKANLGGDERLAYMLRSEQQPDLPEFGDRSPDYVKFVPQTQTIGNQFQETMTDAHDVRRRIAAQANNMAASARTAEQGAARTAYPRNAYGIQVDQTMRSRPGAFENPNLMTPQEMKASLMRQNADDMQHRLTFTDDSISEAYDRLDAKAGGAIDRQQVYLNKTDANGVRTSETLDLTLQEQLEMGAELQRQGYGREIDYVPQGQSVEYAYHDGYPAWERKNHQLSANPQMMRASKPVSLVPYGVIGQGSAVQVRY